MRWWVLGLCGVVLGAGTADAQPRPDGAEGATSQDPKAAFAAGEQAFARGDYTAALAAFEQTFEVAAHDAVRFNIAVCLERLGRYQEAVDQYQAAAKSEVLDPAARRRAREAAAAARANLATLIVEGPASASVRVDGQRRCVAPCRVEVDPGRREVIVGEGAAERVVVVELERGRELTLRAPASAPIPPRPEPPPTKPAADRDVWSPGWLTWTGAGIAVVGGAGIVGFGLRTSSLHDDYVNEPTQERLDDGTTARTLTNVSIGVAVLGGVLIAVDLLLVQSGRRGRAATTHGANAAAAVRALPWQAQGIW